MSTLAPSAAPDTRLPGELLTDQELAVWKRRVRAAKEDRRRFEPHWQICLAFAAGKMHLEWRGYRGSRQLYLPPLKRGKHRYTVDEISEIRMTALGELAMDDDRPQVLFLEDDLPTEEYTQACNDAVAAGWNVEWMGDQVLQDVRRTIIDVGTAAARCRFDPTVGKLRLGQVPHQDGRPILDEQKARDYVATQQERGQSANLKSIHEGAIRWDHGTPFNVLVPPGIKREEKFPWEGWVEPVHVDKIREEFGSAARALKPDRIDDINQLGSSENADIPTGPDPDSDAGTPAKLEDHVFLYTIYERPNVKHPKGRVLIFAGQTLTPLAVRDLLPYVAPDGTYRSGVHYFHYIRLTDRFWSKGLVELAKDANKAINKRRSQIAETIDRGQPYILAQKGSMPARQGVPVEILEVSKNAPAPQISSGIPVGDWMFKEVDALREDMRRTTGLQDVLQGQNPTAVGNYSQLALLREQAGRKFDPIVTDFKLGVSHLVEDSLYDIRRYWPADKLLAVTDEDTGQLRRAEFDATKMPDFYRVYIPRGAAKPRSQAAELKKIDDTAAFAINSGAVQKDPDGWVQWLRDSYEAGKPVDLPTQDTHDQLELALMENDLLCHGQMPKVEYWYDHATHVQVCRSLQSRADAAGDEKLSGLCEQHVLMHEQAAQAQAQQTQMAQQASGLGPAAGAPPGDLPFPRQSPFSIFSNLRYGPGGFGI